ncbi:MAG TPA: hypothetical protein VK595_15140 [Vicinamibacterales bacterium]|nr:hypothetical protein [Vicinamibacterales bacterium]
MREYGEHRSVELRVVNYFRWSRCWWDYTTLDRGLIEEAARLTPRDLLRLSRPGFRVVFYDTVPITLLRSSSERRSS